MLFRSMEHVDGANEEGRKPWARAIFIWVFLCIWLTGMTAGLMTGACRQDRYEGERKLRFCNISLAAAKPFEILLIERAKGSIIHLERGIALAQMGQGEDAIDAFAQAIISSRRAAHGAFEEELHRRMRGFKDERVIALWISAVQNFQHNPDYRHHSLRRNFHSQIAGV